ncbi:aminoglycoside phosphotransferase family protein [Streptococcus pacificus]|uniref:Aminoglycoside phosphotransferase family protein n=1 Tax=Streptococcus pacificus TaxID=2740577 RepID=A0ABS0ZIV3_9STRE|nr:aminoglycoside phosphotransferase family protein [Streptococcus pacificus]MBJ8325887.1 aminoglycoside phosphotransferase family protein [Streptococcus pacificus]
MFLFDELDYKSKVDIEKGFSDEKKYHIIGNKDYLLKISPLSYASKKQLEVKYAKALASVKINVASLIDVKYGENHIESLYPWINGQDFSHYSKTLSKTEHYQYGFLAGEYVRQIHSIIIDETVSDWETIFNCKIDKKIVAFNPVKTYYPKGKIFIDFINQHRYLLENRPQTLCHGDYHVGNMMIEEKTKKLTIVDFGSLEIGDPYEEFNRMVWNAMHSEDFASGVLQGYFANNAIPEDFWLLMALYMAVDIISSISWAVNRGDKQIDTMKTRADRVLEWYDSFNLLIPKFYQTLFN